MLERYLEQGWPRAGAAERAAFERLLDAPDPELHALLTGAAAPAEPELARLLARMRADDGACPLILKVELPNPDGRPLHGYQCTDEIFARLEESLKKNLETSSLLDGMAREFVFWAAEHIRSRFSGGKLTWDFVFNRLGCAGDHALGKALVEQGLREWRRSVVGLASGRQMYLYSLMYEGGVPEALLQEESLYRTAVMGLVTEIERERNLGDMSFAVQIANRWIKCFPQTFRGEDFKLLLAELADSLVKLRARLPEDLPEGKAQDWLDGRYPKWRDSLPLRMTPSVAETLVRPVLETSQSDALLMSRPVVSREMRRESNVGKWLGYLIFRDVAWLPSQMFPSHAQGLRLWLLPTGVSSVHVRYYAMPERGGWKLRRFSGTKDSFQFSPYEEFAFTASADNRFIGEVIVDSGLSSPEEAPSFWKATDISDGMDASRLVPLHGEPRTRTQQIWLLAARNIDPVGDMGLSIGEPEDTQDGRLWCIKGCGDLYVGDERYSIRTGAEEENREASMFPIGNILLGWRRGGTVPVYQGACKIIGVDDTGLSRVLPERQLRRVAGRLLCSEITEWIEEGETLSRAQHICLPAGLDFDLQECGAGKVSFNAKGLESGWVVTLRAAGKQVSTIAENGRVFLELEIQGVAPGLVDLRLYDQSTGKVLELQSVWPAESAMLLNPQGQRLTQNEPISIDALDGWRAVVPYRVPSGHLQLKLTGQSPISLLVKREVSLAANSPLIRAMLAQGGPDAQVNVKLHVGGMPSKRLEIRRYHHRAAVNEDILQVRLDRDKPEMSTSTLSNPLRTGCVELHAVDINTPERAESWEDIATLDLRALLGRVGGPWLIQSRFNNRVQCPVIWGPNPLSPSSREISIQACAEEWRRILSVPQDRNWDVLWNLIEAVRTGGDMGSLSQVQALAQVPAAIVALAMRVPDQAVSVVMSLDTASPIFWPSLPVVEFISAIDAERRRQVARWSEFSESFSEGEIKDFSDKAIMRRVKSILVQRPELTIHFGKALIETEIFHEMIRFKEYQETLCLCLLPKSKAYQRLEQLFQQVVRRIDNLPAGVHCLEPLDSPFRNRFAQHIQPLIDAPFVVAEIAAGRRSELDIGQRLALINLRHVDSAYFDEVFPVALQFLTAEDS